MPISRETERLVLRRWRLFCMAVVQAQEEHGQPVECYFGEGQDVVDRERLAAHHDGEKGGGTFYGEGGAILIHLPEIDGFHQDGGGW